MMVLWFAVVAKELPESCHAYTRTFAWLVWQLLASYWNRFVENDQFSASSCKWLICWLAPARVRTSTVHVIVRCREVPLCNQAQWIQIITMLFSFWKEGWAIVLKFSSFCNNCTLHILLFKKQDFRFLKFYILFGPIASLFPTKGRQLLVKYFYLREQKYVYPIHWSTLQTQDKRGT